MLSKVVINNPRAIKRKLNEVLETPKTITINKIDEENVEKFRENLNAALATGQTVIPIILDSYGGHVYSLLALVDMIKSCPVQIATVIQGKAMSCGAVLFSCGAEGMRFMGENAVVMIHDVNSVSIGKANEIVADAKETERVNYLLYKILANNCGKDDLYFWQLVQERGRADWYLTPEDSINHNLANKIGVPSIEASIKIDYNLIFE